MIYCFIYHSFIDCQYFYQNNNWRQIKYHQLFVTSKYNNRILKWRSQRKNYHLYKLSSLKILGNKCYICYRVLGLSQYVILHFMFHIGNGNLFSSLQKRLENFKTALNPFVGWIANFTFIPFYQTTGWHKRIVTFTGCTKNSLKWHVRWLVNL